ncbi:MAG TPA: hypothetical protein VGR43_02450, partial [Dehalococcoidia bacterium]|nr:hypothetical protein [Dehalococcoidia bacterium]
AAAAIGFAALREMVPTNGPDYCVMANMRSCKVSDRGEWVLVTAPDGAQHMIYLKGGKVLQVQ